MAQIFSEYGITEKECEQGVHEANDFFGLPHTEVINATLSSCTRMRPHDLSTIYDDEIFYNLEELKGIGVVGKQAFTLIMTHECAHRLFRFPQYKKYAKNAWEEELACDFFIGVRAGLHSLPGLPIVKRGLESTSAGVSHPEGYMRGEFIRIGEMHGRINAVNGRTPKFDDYLGYLKEALDKYSIQLMHDRMKYARTNKKGYMPK